MAERKWSRKRDCSTHDQSVEVTCSHGGRFDDRLGVGLELRLARFAPLELARFDEVQLSHALPARPALPDAEDVPGRIAKCGHP